MEDIRYNHPTLQGKCLEFAILGNIYINEYLKNEKINDYKVEVKRHLINEDDPNYSPYHFYLEIHNKKGKVIVDNAYDWRYWEYKDRFKPKQIYKLKQNEIKKLYQLIKDEVTSEFKQLTQTYSLHYLQKMMK